MTIFFRLRVRNSSVPITPLGFSSKQYSAGLLIQTGAKLSTALPACRSFTLEWAQDAGTPLASCPGRPPGLPLPASTPRRPQSKPPSSLLARPRLWPPRLCGARLPGGPRWILRGEKAGARRLRCGPGPIGKPRGAAWAGRGLRGDAEVQNVGVRVTQRDAEGGGEELGRAAPGERGARPRGGPESGGDAEGRARAPRGREEEG